MKQVTLNASSRRERQLYIYCETETHRNKSMKKLDVNTRLCGFWMEPDKFALKNLSLQNSVL